MEIKTTDNTRYHKRELIDNGRDVSWLTVIDYNIRVGNSVLRMAGIAGVGTKEDCRYKGYSRNLMEDTTSYMQQQGYDIALLFGIPDFYYKFGYAVCLAEQAFIMNPKQNDYLNSENTYSLKIREAVDSDVQDIISMYNANNNSRTFTLVRYPEYFKGFPKQHGDGTPINTHIIEDLNGFAGYFTTHVELQSLTVMELECANSHYFEFILKYLLSMVQQKELTDLKLIMPISHQFASFCKKFNCMQFVGYKRCEGGMGRVLNQKSMFNKLLTELSNRLLNSKYNGISAVIHIITETETTELGINNGQIEFVISSIPDHSITLPQTKLIQLISGYRSASDLSLDSDVKIYGERSLFDVLFPDLQPYVWKADHF